jgi:hypothetical protein
VSIFKNVAIHTKAQIDVSRFEFLPVAMLSTSWSDLELTVPPTTDGRIRQGQVLQAAVNFCKAARVLRAKCLLDGLDTPHAMEVIEGADFDFTSGSAVGIAMKKQNLCQGG